MNQKNNNATTTTSDYEEPTANTSEDKNNSTTKQMKQKRMGEFTSNALSRTFTSTDSEIVVHAEHGALLASTKVCWAVIMDITGISNEYIHKAYTRALELFRYDVGVKLLLIFNEDSLQREQMLATIFSTEECSKEDFTERYNREVLFNELVDTNVIPRMFNTTVNPRDVCLNAGLNAEKYIFINQPLDIAEMRILSPDELKFVREVGFACNITLTAYTYVDGGLCCAFDDSAVRNTLPTPAKTLWTDMNWLTLFLCCMIARFIVSALSYLCCCCCFRRKKQKKVHWGLTTETELQRMSSFSDTINTNITLLSAVNGASTMSGIEQQLFVLNQTTSRNIPQEIIIGRIARPKNIETSVVVDIAFLSYRLTRFVLLLICLFVNGALWMSNIEQIITSFAFVTLTLAFLNYRILKYKYAACWTPYVKLRKLNVTSANVFYAIIYSVLMLYLFMFSAVSASWFFIPSKKRVNANKAIALI